MYDVVAIGGGAGGLAAVREARRRGRSAMLISDGPLGGDCTFTGCVPSKTLIESAAAGTDFDEAFRRVRSVVEHIAATESAEVLASEGVEVVEGRAVIVGPGTVEVGGRTIEASGIVLATGSEPIVPAIEGLNEVPASRILTTDSLWQLPSTPESVVIIGGGAIGCELGMALARLGVAVTVIENRDRLLVGEERAASVVVRSAMVESGVDVRCQTSVVRVEPRAGNRIGVQVSSTVTPGSVAEAIETDYVVLAVGRSAAASLNDLLDAPLDLTPAGFVATSASLETSMAGVFAAGDITGLAPFTTAADAMGRLAAANIIRRSAWPALSRVASPTKRWSARSRLVGLTDGNFDPSSVPRVTFTDPEVASIGLREDEAATKVRGALVAELPLSEHDRAVTAGRTQGYIKLIAGPRRVGGMLGGGRLLGATIVAPRAGEMVAELSLLMRTDAMVGRLAQTMHPYPSWSYGLQKAAGQFFTEVEGRSARPAVG